MTLPWRLLLALMLACATLLGGCGGGGSGSASPSPSPSPTPSPSPSGPQAAAVNIEQFGTSNTFNTPYVSVTVCDSSGNNCQAVDHVLLDTGSTGLRIFANALTSGTLNSLQTIALSSGTTLGACAGFASGSLWGDMRMATVRIGGVSTTQAIPIQIIGDPNITSAPRSSGSARSVCSGNFSSGLSAAANGLLGVGNLEYDCGSACDPATGSPPAFYYSCASGSSTCSAASVPLAQQGINPVAMFPTGYNNGVVLALGAVAPASQPVGTASAAGNLIFGIGTQSDNTIAGSQTYVLDDQADFQASVNGTTSTCTDVGNGGSTSSCGFVDSGSNAYFLALPYGVGEALTECDVSVNGFFYCLSSGSAPVAEQVTISSGATSTVFASAVSPTSIEVGDAVSMFNTNDAALPDLAGSALPGSFAGDVNLGLPFFFGRSIGIGLPTAGAPYGYLRF